MSPATDDTRTALLEKIRNGMRKADETSKSLKRKNNRYIAVGVIAGAVGTIISASAAAIGPSLGQGPPAWKLTCAVAAVCTGVATIFTGLQRQFMVAERMAKAMACTGKLNSLEFALTISNRETGEVAKEYESVIANYQDIIF